MKKKIPAVFAVLLALTLTISQVVCAFAETAAQTDAIAFADGTYTVPADTDQRMFYIVSDEGRGRTDKRYKPHPEYGSRSSQG